MKTGILALSLLLGAAPLVAAQYEEGCDENTVPPNNALNTPGVAPLSVASNLRTYTVEPLHRGRKPWPTVRPKGNARPTALPYDGETSYGYGTGNEASGDYPVNDGGDDIGGDQPASSGYGQGNDNLLGGGWSSPVIQAGGGYGQPTPAAGGYQTGWGYSAPATEATEISDVGSTSMDSETIATEAVAFSASTSQSVSTGAAGGYASPTVEGSVDEGGYATSTVFCSASEAATDYSSSPIEAKGLSTSQTAAVSETGVTGAYSVPTVQAYSSPSLEATGGYATLSSEIIAGSASYTSPEAATSATEAVLGSSSSSGMASSSASATGATSFSAPLVQAVAVSSASYSATSTGTSFSVLTESEGHPTASSASVAIAQSTTTSAPEGYAVASESSLSAASIQSTSSSTASSSVKAASDGGSSFATLPVSAANNGTGNYQVASAVSPAAYASTTNTTVASSLTMTRTVYLSSQSSFAATAAATTAAMSAASAGYTFTTRRPYGKGGPKQICSCWNEY